MSVREILQLGDPFLRQPAEAVADHEFGTPELESLVADLIDTMRAANGAGIAAPQIGVGKKVCVIEVGDNPRYPYKPNIPLTVLFNPEIELLTDERFDNYEGCLSVPNIRGVVPRATRIRLKARDRSGAGYERVIEGLTAGTFQHECDHLEGKLFVDHVSDSSTFCTWENFARYEQAAFTKRVEALVEKYKS